MYIELYVFRSVVNADFQLTIMILGMEWARPVCFKCTIKATHSDYRDNPASVIGSVSSP